VITIYIYKFCIDYASLPGKYFAIDSTGTQSKAIVASVGINCRLISEPTLSRHTRPVFSSQSTTASPSTQALSSQGSDMSYRPTQSEENECEEERFVMYTVSKNKQDDILNMK